ncbi:MAG TPA: hypothetical protein VHI77_04395 [Solirubrobacterales bacterium]|jgi:hypothetical protein|nr:hypothetical protein [Solirubrobacterales bacterium]
MKPTNIPIAFVLASLLGGVVLSGCGGGSDSDRIGAVLRDYYEHPAARQCAASTTDKYRSRVYGGSGGAALAACRERQQARSAMTAVQRAVFVDNVRIDGDVAAAEVHAGGITATEALIKRDGEWLLDDEASPFTHGGALSPAAREHPETTGPKTLGQPATFNSVPGIPPAASVRIVAENPIDPGTDREGETTGVFRFGNDFGHPGRPRRVRYVNLPVMLTNLGKAPFRGEVEGFAYDASGYQFAPLNPRDITQRGGVFGRLPDWASGEEKGIAPGQSTTRYLTFAVPAGVPVVKWVVKPALLSRPGTVMGLEPLEGVTYTPSSRPNA